MKPEMIKKKYESKKIFSFCGISSLILFNSNIYYLTFELVKVILHLFFLIRHIVFDLE